MRRSNSYDHHRPLGILRNRLDPAPKADLSISSENLLDEYKRGGGSFASSSATLPEIPKPSYASPPPMNTERNERQKVSHPRPIDQDVEHKDHSQHPTIIPRPILDRSESQTTDDDHAKNKTVKVQLPEIPKPAGGLPYPHLRQDSDAFSSRASILTEDEDSEEYDWSDEEDLVDEEARFTRKMGVKAKREGWGFKKIISVLFSSLVGSTLLAAIIAAPAILIHFYWYKPHPTDHRRFVKDNVQAWLFWAASNIVVSWYLAMIIDIIPILLRFFISATWGHISESVKTKIESYDSVKDSIKPAFYGGSAYASWAIIFQSIYKLHNPADTSLSRAKYTNRLVQVVQFFFFFVLVWCIQRMISHFIAFSFHRTAYRDRIDEVKKALDVIETIRAYRPKIPTHTPNKSGTRTPTFGFSAFGALSEKQHYKMLHGALQNATPRSRPMPHFTDESDVDEANKTLVESSRRREHKKDNSRNRLSWFSGGGGSKPEEEYNEKQDASTTPPRPPFAGKDDIDLRPIGTSQPQNSTSNPPIPSHLNPHRYPPSFSPRERSRSASPRPSVDHMSTPDAAIKQAAKVIKNAVLHDARNLSGKSEGLANLAWNVNSSHEAKKLARSIFNRFKNRGRTWLVPADFYPAFPDHEAAENAFKVFDKDNNGDITRAEIKTTILKIYKERRFLSRSMRDVGEALKTLDRILFFFAMVVLFFISLSVFGVKVGDSLTSVYSLLIAASFIFKNAASSAFDAIMFLFVTHPYDTGDRVFVDQENLVVKKVGLFATVFTRSDGTETYYFNSQLFNKFIINVRRSGKTFENLTMQVAWNTPLTKLDALEKCLNDWLSTEENRWYEPSTNITLQHIMFQRHLSLTIGIGHNGNWQDWGLRNARRTAFHAAVQYYCRQLGITAYQSPQPIVFTDPSTRAYNPATPGPEDPLSPVAEAHLSPEEKQRKEEEVKEAEIDAKKMKASLGFLPPLAYRSSHLVRARRSKNRKANMGAVNG
ncbi:hypothetical protein CVT24_007714 [Panaeolus cyanescens]|uniref:EF-hand domain-containing protein n=1 Tax=Panaeolus cyanescens TaxID=181874 RepID=A0A409VR74_9AGAR|nr:hypothetical protein CVT24_007714 [Panaeolus cyanescens]